MPDQFQLERERPLSWQMVEAKRQWHYWRSQHKRAKERIEQWKLRCGEADRKLADAQQRIAQLQERIEALEQENAGLQQRSRPARGRIRSRGGRAGCPCPRSGS